jgi:hypothetical protein
MQSLILLGMIEMAQKPNSEGKPREILPRHCAVCKKKTMPIFKTKKKKINNLLEFAFRK